MGSLTGAVASQKVTEAPKGSLRAVRNRAGKCKGKRELDSETLPVELGRKSGLVIRRLRVEVPSLNG